MQGFEALANAAKQFSAGINMGFLYDPQRRLFGIGYLVGGPREFTSHYDLLASECRLASLVAIAKGDVPVEHWFALARPHASSAGGQTLLSWSGTMFEYLMPLLFTRTFANSLLDQACREAVRRQIEYGREKQVPWGVSESAYSALDANQIYQYRAFGVPALALKQGLDDDLVVAPYATMLALSIDPTARRTTSSGWRNSVWPVPWACTNRSISRGKASRDGDRGVVIYAYMAHHQGMSLAGAGQCTAPRRDAAAFPRRSAHSRRRIAAVRTHSDSFGSPWKSRTQVRQPIRPVATEEPAERTWKEETSLPRVHLQGNGRYSLMVTNSGGGYSRWNDFDLTRWRSDTTLRSVGQLPLYPRSAIGRSLGRGPSARWAADRAQRRLAFPRIAPSFTGGCPASKPFWK